MFYGDLKTIFTLKSGSLSEISNLTRSSNFHKNVPFFTFRGFPGISSDWCFVWSLSFYDRKGVMSENVLDTLYMAFSHVENVLRRFENNFHTQSGSLSEISNLTRSSNFQNPQKRTGFDFSWFSRHIFWFVKFSTWPKPMFKVSKIFSDITSLRS